MPKKQPTKRKKSRFQRKSSFSLVSVIFIIAIFASLGVAYVWMTRAASPNVSGPDYFGMNMGHMEWGNFSRSQVDAALSDAKAAGVRWIRMSVQWSDVQGGGPNSWDWGGTDKVVDAANAQGIKVLAVLTYSPKWAIAPQYQGLTQKADWEIHEPVNMNDFANFARATAQRYGPRGVHHYQIWNEANCYYWKPGPDAVKYTNMLKASYPAIKQGDSGAVVVGSGFAPYGQYPQVHNSGGTILCVNPLKFLEDIYANGAKNYFDALGWHPYNWNSGAPGATTPWNGMYQIYGTNPSALSIMAANGDNKKVWMTEWGYPVGNDEEASGSVTRNNEPLQGQYVTEGFNIITKASWAGPLFWYNYQDGSFGTNQSYGLKRSDGSKRPSWYAFQAAVAANTPDTQKPSGLSVISPTANQKVTGTLSFNGTASDNTGVTKVEYYVDNNLAGTAVATVYGWILSNWDSKKVSDGNHSVFMRAYDAAGNNSQSATVTFSVSNPTNSNPGPGPTDTTDDSSKNDPPVSEVPIGSTSKALPVVGTVSLKPPIADPATVLKVEYYVDGKLVHTATDGNFGYDLDTSKLKNGVHIVTTKVYNKDGTVTTTNQKITVRNPVKLWQRKIVWFSLITVGAAIYALWRFRNTLFHLPVVFRSS